MAGDGNKVLMGAAWVTFGTVAGNIGEVLDLGYTKGGVSFTLETQSYEVTVDQEGVTPIAETLMGRRVTVECPLAESDYERLNKLIPESTYTMGTLEVASGVGAKLMDYTDELVITAKDDVDSWIKIYKAAPIANVRSTFSPSGERLWPIQFKGYVCEVGHTHAGKIMAFHEAT